MLFSVILLVVNSNKLSEYMDTAHSLGMTAEEGYVFIHYHWLTGMSSPHELWFGPTNKKWSNLLLLSLRLPAYETYMEFMDSVVSWYSCFSRECCRACGLTINQRFTKLTHFTLRFKDYQ